ncbi:hypothetical protein [Mycobacterium sp. ACS1612]|uniref:hypothetical protein n=1 Tax=Mycobacterium sp. ACS1612 TaxID=1834117 RepID=UPI000A3F453D|nr:hypothetical protein [Mycobacterium sp. ACS1612]
MNSVDQSVRFVEFVTQAGGPAPGDRSGVTLDPSAAAFRGLNFSGDFVDVGVQ